MSTKTQSKKNKPLALVTGASKRLGKQIATELGRMGYAIALHYFNSESEAKITACELETEGNPGVLHKSRSA